MKKTAPPASQFTAIIDTREQTPFDLSPLRTITAKLDAGDYSVEGLEHHIQIERKSLADLVQCVGGERKRFDENVIRLLAYPVRALVIEANAIDIEMEAWKIKNPKSKITKNQVRGSIVSWARQGLPIFYAGDARLGGLYVASMLYDAARKEYEKLEKLTRYLEKG